METNLGSLTAPALRRQRVVTDNIVYGDDLGLENGGALIGSGQADVADNNFHGDNSGSLNGQHSRRYWQRDRYQQRGSWKQLSQRERSHAGRQRERERRERLCLGR